MAICADAPSAAEPTRIEQDFVDRWQLAEEGRKASSSADAACHVIEQLRLELSSAG